MEKVEEHKMDNSDLVAANVPVANPDTAKDILAAEAIADQIVDANLKEDD